MVGRSQGYFQSADELALGSLTLDDRGWDDSNNTGFIMLCTLGSRCSCLYSVNIRRKALRRQCVIVNSVEYVDAVA